MRRGKGPMGKVVIPAYPGAVAAFPSEYWCQLPFIVTKGITLASGGFTQDDYFINNLNDPGGDVSALKAKYFVTLTTIYKYYVVRACKWKLTCLSQSAATAIDVVALVTSDDTDPTLIGNMSTMLGAKTRIMGPIGSGSQKIIIRGYTNMSQVFGFDVSKELTCWGQGSTADPTRIVRMYVGVNSLDGTSGASVQYRLEMKFYAKFFQRELLNSPDFD